MNLYDIVLTSTDLCKDHPFWVVVIVVVILKCIQITPININPLTWIKSKLKLIGYNIGEVLTANTNGRLEDINIRMDNFEKQLKETESQLKDQLNTIEMEADQRLINTCKWEILNFAGTLPDKKQSEEDFNHIFERHDDYDALLEKYNMKNGKTDRAMEKVNKWYREWYINVEMEDEVNE